MKYVLIILTSLTLLSFVNKEKESNSYIIEITTFKMKSTVNTEEFWKEDAKIDANYTSKQPGYISRESGFDKDTNEVLVVAKWNTKEDADASMHKFMTDNSVADYVNMIEGTTMKMKRYLVD
jgi:PKD repeat protein